MAASFARRSCCLREVRSTEPTGTQAARLRRCRGKCACKPREPTCPDEIHRGELLRHVGHPDPEEESESPPFVPQKRPGRRLRAARRMGHPKIKSEDAHLPDKKHRDAEGAKGGRYIGRFPTCKIGMWGIQTGKKGQRPHPWNTKGAAPTRKIKFPTLRCAKDGAPTRKIKIPIRPDKLRRGKLLRRMGHRDLEAKSESPPFVPQMPPGRKLRAARSMGHPTESRRQEADPSAALGMTDWGMARDTC